MPAERILLLTFTRRASREMLQRARGAARRASSRGSSAARSTRSRIGSCAGTRRRSGLPRGFGVLDAGDAADVLDLVREEHGPRRSRARASRARGRCWTSTRARSTRSCRCRDVLEPSTSRGARSTATRSRRCSSAYTARKRALGVLDLDDLLLYWRALARDERGRAAARRARSTTCSSTSTRTSTACRSTSSRALARARAGGDRGRRRLPGDLRLPLGLGGAHPRLPGALPGHARGDAGAQLPLDAAAARRRQRRRRAGRARVPEAAARASARAATRPQRRVRARRGARRPRRSATACWRRASRACELREQAVLARTSHDSDLLELELTRRRIPFVSTAACATSRPRTSRTSSRCCGWPTTAPTRSRGSACCSCVEGVGPVQRAAGDRRAVAADGRRSLAASRVGAARASCPDGARASCADPLIAAIAAARDERGAGPARRGAARRARAADRGALPRRRAARAGPRPARRAPPTRRATRATSSPSSCSTRRSSSADLAQPPHLDEDYLVLSTIHSAKGLEWDSRCTCSRPTTATSPPAWSAGTSESIDEERRLLYVAHDPRAAHAHALRPASATTTARAAATTRTATASRRASSRPRCSPRATSRACRTIR